VSTSPDLFETFVTFGSVMHRMALLSPGVPTCNVGDALTALATLPAPGAPWPFDGAVDPATFAKLGFADTSRGIALSQRNNREGWWAHARRTRELVEAAAKLNSRRELALVLGVGHGFDLPLASLASSFNRLVLVDVDGATVESAVAALPSAERARANIDVRTLDVTGINHAMVPALDGLTAAAGSADEVRAGVENHVRSYRLAASPAIARPDERPDLVVSSCLLTQLAWPQRAYAHEALRRRFGPFSTAAERSWSLAWAQLELRIQQDHIDAVAGAGEIATVISDTVNHLTQVDTAGREHPIGQAVAALGVESLVERIPKAAGLAEHSTWVWHRHRPGPRGEPGSLMTVEGVILR
jgi:hypothetical protein